MAKKKSYFTGASSASIPQSAPLDERQVKNSAGGYSYPVDCFARFDADHLRAWFGKARDNYFGSWFWTPPMDLMSATALLLGDARCQLANFKLGTVCEYLGIEATGELHDASVDVEMTIELYRRLTAKWFEALVEKVGADLRAAAELVQ